MPVFVVDGIGPLVAFLHERNLRVRETRSMFVEGVIAWSRETSMCHVMRVEGASMEIQQTASNDRWQSLRIEKYRWSVALVRWHFHSNSELVHLRRMKNVRLDGQKRRASGETGFRRRTAKNGRTRCGIDHWLRCRSNEITRRTGQRKMRLNRGMVGTRRRIGVEFHPRGVTELNRRRITDLFQFPSEINHSQEPESENNEHQQTFSQTHSIDPFFHWATLKGENEHFSQARKVSLSVRCTREKQWAGHLIFFLFNDRQIVTNDDLSNFFFFFFSF